MNKVLVFFCVIFCTTLSPIYQVNPEVIAAARAAAENAREMVRGKLPGLLAGAQATIAAHHKKTVTDPIMWQNTLRVQAKIPYTNLTLGLYNKDFVAIAELGAIFAIDCAAYRHLQGEHVHHTHQLLTKKTKEVLAWLENVTQNSPELCINAQSYRIQIKRLNKYQELLKAVEIKTVSPLFSKRMLYLIAVIATREILRNIRRRFLVSKPENPLAWSRYERGTNGALQHVTEFPPPLGLSGISHIAREFVYHPIKSIMFFIFIGVWRHITLIGAYIADNDLAVRMGEDMQVPTARFILKSIFPFIPNICFSKVFRLLINYAMLRWSVRLVDHIYQGMWIRYMFEERVELYELLKQYQALKFEAIENPTHKTFDDLKATSDKLLECAKKAHHFNRLFSREAFTAWRTNREISPYTPVALVILAYLYWTGGKYLYWEITR